MFPITFFPALTVCGNDNEKPYKEGENYVSFKAMCNQASNGMRAVYIFNAFDTVADRVKRMNPEKGSQVTIVAEMKDYMDGAGARKQSYNIIKVDYIRIDENARKSREKEKDSEKEKSVSEKKSEEKEPKSVGTIDMTEFQKMFG